MNLLLLTEHPDLHSTKRLLEESTKLNIDATLENPYTKPLYCPDKSDYRDLIILHRTTGIRHGDFDLNLSQIFEQGGAQIFNSVESFFKLRDKQKQAIFCNYHNLKTVPGVSFRKKPEMSDIEKIVSFFKSNGFELNSDESFILKAFRGNQGVGVNLINGRKSLFSILETLWAIQDQEFLIQPFIENMKEYRILAVGEKIYGAVEKWPSKNEFRANSLRGDAKFISTDNLPVDIKEISKKIMSHSKATYAGIDLVIHKDCTYLLEINLVPGFKLFENLSNQNIAKEIIDYIINRAKENR